MNTASFYLCKELCALSDWRDYMPYYWVKQVYLGRSSGPDYKLQPLDILYQDYGPEAIDEDLESFIPAYDLGYLLRKLPQQLHGVSLDLFFHTHGNWVCHYSGTPYYCGADTPEDAACKLCCELIRQGIIKP